MRYVDMVGVMYLLSRGVTVDLIAVGLGYTVREVMDVIADVRRRS